MGDAPECAHGTRVYVSRLPRNGGSLWHAWGCPTEECDGDRGSDNPGLIFKNKPKENS